MSSAPSTSVGDALPARAFLRKRRGSDGKLVVGGRAYTGYFDYRATAAAEGGARHDGREQERHTLLLDDIAHARQHLPGLDALAADAATKLPRMHDEDGRPMHLLHGHVLDQTSLYTRFSDHQDTEENRARGRRQPDRRVNGRNFYMFFWRKNKKN